MTVENNVLSALNKVKKYKKLGKENIALCGASNRPIVVLQKKESVSKLSDLEGKWIISEAASEAIPDGIDVYKRQLHCCVGRHIRSSIRRLQSIYCNTLL